MSSLVSTLLLLSFPSVAQTRDTYLIPQVCIERANEIGIFSGVTDESITRSKLKTQNASKQTFDFQAIADAYQGSLNKLNQQLENYKSPLFHYLQNCRDDERNCHGYFKFNNPTNDTKIENSWVWKNPIELLKSSNKSDQNINPFFDFQSLPKIPTIKTEQDFYLQIYCDREIFRSAISIGTETKENQHNKCTDQPFNEIDVTLLDELDEPYNKECFYQTNIEGKVYLRNKSQKYLKEIQNLQSWYDKFATISLKAVQKSLIPEGTLYILKKIVEEFQDSTLQDSKINDLNKFYNRMELAQEFQSCCQADGLNLEESQMSMASVGKSVENIINNNTKPETFIFHTQSYLSDLIFDKAEGQYWIDLLKNQSPRELSEKQKLNYMAYLQKNPLLYQDTTSFGTLVKQVKSNPESVQKTSNQSEDDQNKLSLYQKQIGFTPLKPSYDYEKYGNPPFPIPGVAPGATYGNMDFLMVNMWDVSDSPDIMTQNILFNPQFAMDYQQDLQKKADQQEKKDLEEKKKKDYPKIFKSFIHYQFARVAQAKVIRELQKKREGDAKGILSDVNTFHQWVESITCNGLELTFCSADHENFRKKKHAELYEKIISGQIDLEYNVNANKPIRKYIYNQIFIDKLNTKIKTINQYCFDVASPSEFKSNQEAFFNKNNPHLQEMMEEFYATPRIEELLGQTDFADTMRFKPAEIEISCFTKGYVFGFLPYSKAGQIASTPVNTGYAGITIYPENGKMLSSMSIQQAYLPSNFQISKDSFHELEDHIEDKISDEITTLRKAYRYNHLSEYENFLKESTTTRIFALIDYGIDNPSKEIGKHICNLIQEADASEYGKQRTRELIANVALIGASAATLFVLPAITTGAIVLYEAGASIAITSISIGTAVYKIQYYNHKNGLIDIASITGNIDSRDALKLHDVYLKNTSDAKETILIDLALLAIVGGKPIVSSKNYIQKVLDKEYNFIRRQRLAEIKDLTRNTSGEINFQYKQQVEDFLLDYKKVSDIEFRKFKAALSGGKQSADDFILANWKNQLEKYIIPAPSLLKKTWNEITYTVRDIPAVKKTVQFTQNASKWIGSKSIYLKPYFYQFRSKLNQYFLSNLSDTKWYKWYPYKQLNTESVIVNMVRNADEVYKQTGRLTFSKSEIETFASKMKYYALDESGNFYRLTDKTMKNIFEAFMSKAVKTSSVQVRAYLKRMIEGELLQDEWKLVLSNFDREIKSLEDCKSFMKVIKYSKKEYSGLRSQITNFAEIVDPRELVGPYIYQQRTNEILQRINIFYDIAQYSRYKNDIRIFEELRKYFQTTRRNENEIVSEIQTRDPGFLYYKKMEDYEKAKTFVTNFETSNAAIFENSTVWRGELKYEKAFLAQEKKYNNYFHKKLHRFLKKEPDPVKAYEDAWIRTQLKKKTEYECSLPNSLHRQGANKLYQNTAKTITLTTTAIGYWSTHLNDEKNSEWFGRYGFEMAMVYIGSQWQSKIFTTKGGGPFYKSMNDIFSGWVMNGVDAASYGVTNRLFWRKDSKYEDEFARIIYESENLEQTIHEYFQSRPEVEQEILQRLRKVKQVFDETDLKISRGTMVDSKLEETFIKAGLIDNVVYSDMEQKNRELGQDYIYHELMESGYLDEDLYKNYNTDEELRDQVVNMLTEIKYQDLYKDRESTIKYPLLPEVDLDSHENLGDVPWEAQLAIPLLSLPANFVDMPMQIQTGNESIDRLLFQATFDVGKFPLAYMKNVGVYSLLCNFDGILPGKTNEYAALALHAVYKSAMDPLKFYFRNQAIGH